MIYNIFKISDLKTEFDSYNDLIQFYQKIPISYYEELNIYTERHHIKPRCLGGDNSKTNLIRLPWYIHLLAHFLLAKELENIDSQNSMKNYYAVRMILNQHVVITKLPELKKLAKVRSIELETKNHLNCKKIFIKKSNEKSILIFEDELPLYEKLGWSKGRTFNRKQNTVWMHNEDRGCQVDKSEVDLYISKGFKLGMFSTKRMREYNHKESPGNKNRKWMYREDNKEDRLLVKQEDIEKYKQKGYLVGFRRDFVYSDELKQKMKNSQRRRFIKS